MPIVDAFLLFILAVGVAFISGMVMSDNAQTGKE